MASRSCCSEKLRSSLDFTEAWRLSAAKQKQVVFKIFKETSLGQHAWSWLKKPCFIMSSSWLLLSWSWLLWLLLLLLLFVVFVAVVVVVVAVVVVVLGLAPKRQHKMKTSLLSIMVLKRRSLHSHRVTPPKRMSNVMRIYNHNWKWTATHIVELSQFCKQKDSILREWALS